MKQDLCLYSSGLPVQWINTHFVVLFTASCMCYSFYIEHAFIIIENNNKRKQKADIKPQLPRVAELVGMLQSFRTRPRWAPGHLGSYLHLSHTLLPGDCEQVPASQLHSLVRLSDGKSDVVLPTMSQGHGECQLLQWM
jgi:hypothetical protein